MKQTFKVLRNKTIIPRSVEDLVNRFIDSDGYELKIDLLTIGIKIELRKGKYICTITTDSYISEQQRIDSFEDIKVELLDMLVGDMNASKYIQSRFKDGLLNSFNFKKIGDSN